MPIDVEIIDVAQDAAVGPRRQLGQKNRLVDCGVAETQVNGGILDEESPAQHVLGTIDVAAHSAQRFLGIGQGQQIVEIGADVNAPG